MEFQAPHIQRITLGNSSPVDVLRIDAIDPIISGNKWFKLKLNLQQAIDTKAAGILTFGGQHSNHLAATAQVCNQLNIPCAAIVRAELENDRSATIKFIEEKGMQVRYVSRLQYKQKTEDELLQQWQTWFPNYFVVPEGGANEFGRKGCEEIAAYCNNYDVVACACGTGTMYAGIRAALPASTLVLGCNVLRGNNSMVQSVNAILPRELRIAGNELLAAETIKQSGIIDVYAGKGYASFDEYVWRNTVSIRQNFGLLLDHVYTSKLFYCISDLIFSGKLSTNQSILLIHSGGLQGNAAFEARYKVQIAKNNGFS